MPPSDLPGWLATMTGLFAIIVILGFGYYVLDGFRRLPLVWETITEARARGSLVPAWLLPTGAGIGMFLALGFAYATYRYEEALHDLAFDAYDVWNLREYLGEALPSGPPAAGQEVGGAVVAAVLVVIAAIVYLGYYVSHGFGRVSSMRRAAWRGVAIIGVIAALIGVTVLLMWHDVGVHEQAWESWFGEEIR